MGYFVNTSFRAFLRFTIAIYLAQIFFLFQSAWYAERTMWSGKQEPICQPDVALPSSSER